MKKTIFMLMSALMLAGVATAQDYRDDPRYGADPESREKNVRVYSFFNDAFESKEYDQAILFMHDLLKNIPKVSENIYIKGGQIYKSKIAKAKTKEERRLYVDSLMWLYDKRIEAFGDNAERGETYIRSVKVREFEQYSAADKVRLFQLYREALAQGKTNVDPDLVVTFFNNLVEGFKLDDITPEELVTDYAALGALLEASKDPKAVEARGVLEQLFVSSGAASCEIIEKIFRPQYDATPDDQVLIEKIIAMFQRAKCSTPFQFTVIEKYYKINPRPEVAAQLAAFYEEKGDQAKALEYLKIAIDHEKDPAIKTNYLVRVSGTYLTANNYREAANYAKQAIAVDPNNGYAYLFLGNAYAGGSSSACSDFDRQTAYWLVVDVLQKARANFSNDPAQAEKIGGMISTYASNFPKSEETFMRGIEPGASYNVNCGWISGATTVRER